MKNTFLYRARSFFMESCGPGTEILVPMLTFVHDEEELPPMSSLILIFATSAHLASLLCMNCYTTCLTSLTSWITSVFASARCDTPVIIHHGIMPRYPTIDLFS